MIYALPAREAECDQGVFHGPQELRGDVLTGLLLQGAGSEC